MKRFAFLFPLCICIGLNSLQAQWTIGKNWKLKRVGIYMGEDQDRLSTMDYTYFTNGLRGATQLDFSDINVTQEYTSSMICENPNLRLNFSFQHQNYEQLELGLNVVGIFDRIDEVTYASPGAYWGDPNYQELRFSQVGNEIAFEPTLGFRSQNGAFALTGIVGANVGYHFGTSLSIHGTNISVCENTVLFRSGESEDPCNTIMQDLYENGQQRNGISTRAFAEIDASFTIAQRLEMGMMLRRGVGIRQVNQAGSSTTNLHAVGVFMKWVLR